MMATFALTPISSDEPACNDALSAITNFTNASAVEAVCTIAGGDDNICSYDVSALTCGATLDGESGFSGWEAMIMTLTYFCYIAMMTKNKELMACIGEPTEEFAALTASKHIDNPLDDRREVATDGVMAVRNR